MVRVLSAPPLHPQLWWETVVLCSPFPLLDSSSNQYWPAFQKVNTEGVPAQELQF